MSGYSKDLLKDRTVVITGAGRGLGKACVQTAVSCGAQVIAVARTVEDLDLLQSEFGSSLTAWSHDVLDPAFHQRLAELDSLDGLINNAGTNRVGYMTDQSVEDLDAVVNLNVRSPWLVSQAAVKVMRRSGGGSIVNMSSQMGHVGSPERTLYCMSKHAVEGLTRAMAVELASDNIRVNSVAPTFVKTPLTEPMLAEQDFSDFVMGMIPMKKLASLDAVANACIFLLSDLSDSTTGSCMKVDGGWTAQ